MRIAMIAAITTVSLTACSYTDFDDSKLRRPSSWSKADSGKASSLEFMRDAELCDDVAQRAAVKRLPINDPGDTGLVVRQRAAADEAIGLKAVGSPQAKVWNSTTQRWEDYKP